MNKFLNQKPITIFFCSFLLFNVALGQELPNAENVKSITEKVADWQIETFEDMGKYRALPSPEKRQDWHNRNKHHELDWTCAALYVGMFQLSLVSGNDRYVEWLNSIGKRNQWQLHNRVYHADDQAVGQLYLGLNEYFEQSLMIVPTKTRFDSILISEEGRDWQWDWCDALFMAPPVWAKLAKITGDDNYLTYMDGQYHRTYDSLFSEGDSLFFRDQSYLDMTEKNGESIFWSRGNGWVFGGLSLMIPDLPDHWEGKQFYVELYRKMAQRLKEIQRPDGTWSGGLLGTLEDYPIIETSGTSFFAFGLAWGINNGILDRTTYEPILLKAWNAITAAVNEDGLLGYVQPVGAAPGESFKDYTEVYGVGAFLAAGSEMYKYVERFGTAKKSSQNQGFITFMKDGGWCWYQDPRAVISKGKLVLAGVSGMNGDVKIGVYDLKKDKMEGEVVLQEDFERDDHDVPALYVREDGSILAIWAKHASEKKHYYSISDPENYLLWGERKEYVHVYEGNVGVTYMNLYTIDKEGLLYNFFRDGSNFNPTFITSSDEGNTWGNRTHFISNDVSGFQRPYTRYLQKDNNTIGFTYSDAHPRDFGNSLYYAEYRDGAFYLANGNKIKDLADGPLRTSEGEKIYIGSETKQKPQENRSVPNSAWTSSIAKDQRNNPVIGYSLYKSDNDHRYRIATWNGKKWVDREVAYAGNCLYSWESSYTGLITLDPTNLLNVYISTNVNPGTGEDLNGIHEIYSATVKSKDDITNIEWSPITNKSSYRNIRPIIAAGEGYKVLLWLSGPWHTYKNYNSDVVGIILEKP